MTFHAKVLNWKLYWPSVVPGQTTPTLWKKRLADAIGAHAKHIKTVWSNLIRWLFSFDHGFLLLPYSNNIGKINKNNIYQIISQSCGTYHWDPRESLASQPMTCDSCGPSVLREIASCCRTRNRWPQFGDMSWIPHLDIMTWQIGIMKHSRCSWTIQTQQGKIACEMNICNICKKKSLNSKPCWNLKQLDLQPGIHSKVGLPDGTQQCWTWNSRGPWSPSTAATKNIFRWKAPYEINRN